MKRKIFITGSRGYIGSRFLSLYRDAFTIADPQVNILSPDDVVRTLSESESSIVIHLAAKTHIDRCEKEKHSGKNSNVWKVNVEGTKHIIDACKKTGSYLIMFSTECVFDGEVGQYTETDIPNPKNWYGETKYRAEQMVLDSGIPACILRSVYTYGHPDHKNDTVKTLLNKLQNSEKIRAVTDQLMSFTFVDDLLRVLKSIINHKPRGIFHYAGTKQISMYEFSSKVATVYGYHQDTIEPVTLEEYFKNRAKFRLRRATLNCEKITRALRVIPSEFDTALAGMRYNR